MISFLSGIYLTGFIISFLMTWAFSMLSENTYTKFSFWLEIFITATFWPVVLVMIIKDMKKLK